MHDLADEEWPVSSEELALERWEDDGGRVGPHPGFETVPPTEGPGIPTKRKSRAVHQTKVDVRLNPERAAGHVSRGGTFDMLYNAILSDRPVKRH